MSRKSRIVRSVKSRRTACSTEHFLCSDLVGRIILYGESKCPEDLIVLHNIVRDVDSVQYLTAVKLLNRLCKQRLHVLAIYLDISVAPCNILSILILEDNQPQLLHLVCYTVQPL